MAIVLPLLLVSGTCLECRVALFLWPGALNQFRTRHTNVQLRARAYTHTRTHAHTLPLSLSLSLSFPLFFPLTFFSWPTEMTRLLTVTPGRDLKRQY